MSTTSSELEAPPAPPGRSLWHNVDFLKFWVGETVSLLGSHVTNLALPLTAIYAFDASDEQVGVLRFLQLAPYLALSLVFGVWVDRVRRRRVMLGANLVRMVLIALVPLLHWLDVLDMTQLTIIACAIGIASVLFDVSWMSLVPTLVKDPQHYVEASAKMGISSSATDVAGPGLAGMLVAAVTAPVALVADAVSYLVSVGTLLLIRTEEPRPVRPAVKRRVSTELGEGLRWVFGDPVLRWLAVMGFCCNFSLITVWTMFLLYGARDLHLGATMLGAVFATASVGGLIGAICSRKVIERFPLGRVYLVAQSALLLGPTLIVLAAGPTPILIGLLILSFFTTYLGLGIAGVIIVSLRQTVTPQSMMGRMTASFRTLLFGGGSLGGLSAGLLSGALGPRKALIVAAVASATAVIGLVISPVSRLRTMPEGPRATPSAGIVGRPGPEGNRRRPRHALPRRAGRRSRDRGHSGGLERGRPQHPAHAAQRHGRRGLLSRLPEGRQHDGPGDPGVRGDVQRQPGVVVEPGDDLAVRAG